MKNVVNRISIFFIVFYLSIFVFDNVVAMQIERNISNLEIYQIKEKREVLVENNKIFDFYENNLEKLNTLVEIKQKQQEELEKLEKQKEKDKKLDFKENIVNFSKQFIGNPYVSGGTSLTQGADCSGFVQSVYANFNIKLPRTTKEQASIGNKVLIEEIEPGDIISYGYNNQVSHSAIYVGDGLIIHSSTPNLGIRIDNMYIMPIITIRRVI